MKSLFTLLMASTPSDVLLAASDVDVERLDAPAPEGDPSAVVLRILRAGELSSVPRKVRLGLSIARKPQESTFSAELEFSAATRELSSAVKLQLPGSSRTASASDLIFLWMCCAM